MSGGEADIRVGDIVERWHGDRHVVTGTNRQDGLLPDLIWTTCIKADDPLEAADGAVNPSIYSVGETTSMCADDVILIERQKFDPNDPNTIRLKDLLPRP